MSKIAAIVLAVSGATVITVGSVLLFKGKGKVGAEANTVTETPVIDWFGDVETFKNGAHQSADCIGDYFDSINVKEKSESAVEISSSSLPDDAFFSNSALTAADKSCLKVQWKKKAVTSGENKWKGKFTWLWTFLKGNEGFINFNVAETTTEANKLKVTGAFYLLKKESETWIVKHKKEVATTPVTIGTSDLGTKFPKKPTDLAAGTDSVNEYWGFLEDTPSLDNMCTNDSDCPNLSSVEPTTKVFTFAWIQNGSGTNKKLIEWSSVDDWWSSIYGSDWNLKDKIQNFQGIWTFQSTPS